MQNSVELIGAFVFTVICIVCARIYSLVNHAYTYWDKKDVKGPRPVYVFGTWKGFANKFLGTEDISNRTKYGKVYGTFDGLTPNLLVTDPEIIKEILDTSSGNFQDLRVATENSVVLKESLSCLSGCEKSQVNELIASLLTSEDLDKWIRKLGSSLDSTLVSLLQEDGEDRQYNFTPLVSKIVNHVIAHSIYGIEPEEEFVKNCSKLFQVNNPQSIMSIMPFLYSKYFKTFWICPENTLQYFVKLIMTKVSEASGADLSDKKELDLIQYLVQAAKKEKESGSKDEEKDLILKDSVVISQALASTLIFAQATRHIVLFGLYSLANNEEIQDKLYNEIIETKTSSSLSLNNINTLRQVVAEVLRLYPFEFRVEKVTTKDIKLGGIELNKGVRVSIPLYALHQSEEIYPEPEKFDAARMVPYPNYLPFGQAGNNSDSCIGFALVASKFILSKLVRDYKFSGVQESYFNNLFEKGFTRIPHPREIDILVKKRV